MILGEDFSSKKSVRPSGQIRTDYWNAFMGAKVTGIYYRRTFGRGKGRK